VRPHLRHTFRLTLQPNGTQPGESSNPTPSSGESGEIHERACGAEVQPHPVHRKPAMKLVPRPGFVGIDRSAPGDPGADEIKRSDF
jgi:hypothetical protein